jgi:hypothetical protein
MEIDSLIDHSVAKTTLKPPKTNCQVCFDGRSTKSSHPYKPLGLLVGPFPHRQQPFCLSTKSWGQVNIFPSLTSRNQDPYPTQMVNHKQYQNVV